MYIDIVKAILEEAVELYSAESDLTVPEVLAKIKEHIDNTAKEHRKAEPEIEYQDPLCRLGYLYRHATANATLFERVLTESGHLRTKLRESKGGALQICSVGGGPGTELLGLAKYLLRRPQSLPRKIAFTVLDNVPQWAETWDQLAEAIDEELGKVFAERGEVSPTIVNSFLQLDVLDQASYKDYLHKFKRTDIVVFNYLFSENKTQLDKATKALRHLLKVTPAGCIFVVIDRLEHDETFLKSVIKAFVDAGFAEPKTHTLEGILDGDEQTVDMGELFNTVLKSPRVKFHTDIYRDPTVFWFEAIRE
jgi:hypothetical protein